MSQTSSGKKPGNTPDDNVTERALPTLGTARTLAGNTNVGSGLCVAGATDCRVHLG